MSDQRIKELEDELAEGKAMFLDGLIVLAWTINAATEAKASWSWPQPQAERQRLHDLLHTQLPGFRLKQ